jgi:hypothetical protein
VKHWNTALAVLATLSASLGLADAFKTVNGKEFKNATVSPVEPDGIVIKTKSGISKIYFVELPKEVQARFGHDPDKIEADAAAARAAKEKRIAQEKAAEKERTETEKEKESKAEADLRQSLDQFEAVEQQARQTYQSATKGTLSGQIFVATQGAGNYKFGAVQVALFAGDSIDMLIPALKNYADCKIQQQTDKSDFYRSGAFYFSFLKSAIQTAETDADGKFDIHVPQSGRFVIAARATRTVGDDTEDYYWLQPISLEGQQQFTQNLSNNNLTSTTGTSSLIHTKD